MSARNMFYHICLVCLSVHQTILPHHLPFHNVFSLTVKSWPPVVVLSTPPPAPSLASRWLSLPALTPYAPYAEPYLRSTWRDQGVDTCHHKTHLRRRGRFYICLIAHQSLKPIGKYTVCVLYKYKWIHLLKLWLVLFGKWLALNIQFFHWTTELRMKTFTSSIGPRL